MPKQLMLMRHGQYVDEKHAKAFRLGDREMLTPEGCKNVDDVAQQMIDAEKIPDVIVHSPAPRTTETALRMRDVFKRVSGRDIPVIADMNLADGFGPDGMKMFNHPVCLAANSVLAISHEPNIAVLSKDLGDMFFAQKGEAALFESAANDWDKMGKSKPVAIFSPVLRR